MQKPCIRLGCNETEKEMVVVVVVVERGRVGHRRNTNRLLISGLPVAKPAHPRPRQLLTLRDWWPVGGRAAAAGAVAR